MLTLAGLEGGDQPMSIKEQVQHLIEEATEPKNLAQGESNHMLEVHRD